MTQSRPKQSALNAKGVQALLRLRHEGEHAELDYTAVARLSGINKGTVQRIFLNESPLTIERFLAIARAFGATTDEAFDVLASVIGE